MKKIAVQNKLILLLLLIATLTLSCRAQLLDSATKQLFFKRISTEEGLPQPTINCILRDSHGFVWIATEGGLSRFDGNEFKTYRHDPDDSTSLSHNVVHFIEEEQATGNLWVGTVSGINYFDRSLERFKVYKTSNPPGTIYANAALDKKRNRLWLACTVGGLRYLDLSLQKVFDVKEPEFKNEIVWTLKLAGDSLVLGTFKGLKILNLQNHKISTAHDQSTVRAILIDHHTIWFGTEGHGLGKIDRDTKNTRYYNKLNGGTNNDNVWSLGKDDSNCLWIGTDGGGLNILRPDKDKSCFYLHSEVDDRSLGGNTIRTIFIEPTGNIWLGTYNSGVSYYEIPPIQFQLYKRETLQENSLRYNEVSSLAEAPDGKIWVGTDGGGLHFLKNGIIHRYELPAPLKHVSVITSLLVDGDDLWIGTFHYGLIYLGAHGEWKQFLHNPDDKTTIVQNTVWSIQKDASGYLWLGTDRGVNRFDTKTHVFNHIENPLGGKINKLFIDLPAQTILITLDNMLWIGSYGTLMRYNPTTDSIIQVKGTDKYGHAIPDLRVKALLEDNDKIWIGTYGSGLCQYNSISGAFSILDERDGLPDNSVLALERDRPGSLWLGTNQGLVHFNEADTSITVLDSHFGVQGIIFNRSASLQTRDGYLIFGGTKGFNVFKPQKIKPNENSLAVVFTGFQIFNEQIKPGSASLKKSITETTNMVLSHASSRLITFHFSAFNFLSPEKIIYQYKLEGFNNDWQTAGKDHSVTFTNLDPDDYKLSVKASLNGQTWGPEKSITLIIQTVWWKTFYFRIALFVIFCLMAFSFYKYRLYNLRQRKKILEHLVAVQSQEIKRQNDDLASQNEELKAQNEEMGAQQETITGQNFLLSEAKKNLQTLNESLEKTVQHRTEKLNETILQLNKTIKELDAFVYSASHDLIAPLKSVMGLINLMRIQNKQDDINDHINLVEASIKKLEDVIKNLIQYSQNSSMDILYEEVNLFDLIQNCLIDVKFLPGMESMNTELNIKNDTTVVSDPNRLKIVIGNLISNAVKYRDIRKENHTIKIEVEKGKTVWKLTVFDNGIGIAKQYLSRIFEMFFRATDRSQGSGLGLYIVKEAVDRLYGEIYVDSENGLWTKFTIAIPNEKIYVRKK
ncbi:MAG TPA: two-component regulator propeller domain-containing protein [Cyclobacteriaceae bacterium]|nr:two-component regulator propeller domain-containing protein [Cyclobacteriaceae bacterium]